MDKLDANSLFLVQCVIAAVIGGLEFCFPALFGDTMIVNAIVVYTMRETSDPKIKKDVIQAFLFQFGLHIIVLLRPQVWGFLTPFNKVNLLCSFGLAAAYGYLLMGDKRKISTGLKVQDSLKRTQQKNDELESQHQSLVKQVEEQDNRIKQLMQHQSLVKQVEEQDNRI